MRYILSTPIVFFLLGIFVHAIVEFGGEITPSFLFILALSPFWLWQWRYDHTSKNIACFYVIMIVIQIIWAIYFSETDKMTQIKGIMVTFSGLLFFLFYYPIIRDKPSLLKWYIFGEFIASFFYIDMIAIREEGGEEEQIWKFQIFPRIVRLTIMLYLFSVNSKFINKTFPIIFVGVGLLGLLTGARSAGLSLLTPGVFFIALQYVKRRTKIKYALFIGGIALYLIYSQFYVPRVLDGRITGGNTEQLLKVENPRNPFNLLLIGRSDSFVPFYAFFDKPLTGWGLGTSDPDYKYHYLQQELVNQEDEFDVNNVVRETIPGHSVWGSYSCSYGILMFITIFLFIAYIFRLCYRYIYLTGKYKLYCIYLAYAIIWSFLFSPYPTLKTTLSINMAFLVALLISQKKLFELANE